MRKFYRDQDGVHAVEYGLLLCCVALIILGGIANLGAVVGSMYTGGANRFP
jgi:Flp pilus assembly pilin Flp